MEEILNFIVDNIWWLLIAFIFLSGFSKSKKKKGERVDQDLGNGSQNNSLDEYNWSEDEEEIEPNPKGGGVFDSLPVPGELKELLREFRDEEETPWNRSKPQKQVEKLQRQTEPFPAIPQHYDAPYSGEGKEVPHEKVQPSYDNSLPYSGQGKVINKMPGLPRNLAAEYSGEGKIHGKAVVKPQVAAEREFDAYAPHPLVDILKKAPSHKMAEAVIMAEILAKPKALRRNKSNTNL